VRYGVRLLRKSPGFTLVALAALALGLGATTAIFSVVDAVLLKPLPYPRAGRLLVIWEKNPSQNQFKLLVAGGNFLEWQQTEPRAAIGGGLPGRAPHSHRRPQRPHATPRN
jgi:putative ABC transport system permease protein